MDYTKDFQYQLIPLPWDIQAEKFGGRYDTAKEMIKRRIARDGVPECLKKRLEIELIIMEHEEIEYSLTKEQLFGQISEELNDFTMEELDELVLDGRIDFTYINGEQRFLRSSCSALIAVYPQLYPRRKDGYTVKKGVIDDIIDNVRDGDKFGAHIHIAHHLTLNPDDDVTGQVARVHIPVSWEGNPRVNNLKIVGSAPEIKMIAPDDATHHTCYFETKAEKGSELCLEYEYDYIDTYKDMYNLDPKLCEKPVSKEIADKYLCEQLPHIAFTPYMKALAAEIVGDETNPLLKARLIYDYLTTRIRYRYTRCYTSVYDVSEYMMACGRGDCGMYALSFITLCRIVGVPAKWESGTTATPGDIGMHDWAMFYIEGIGWRHVDGSFGSSANRNGNEKRRQFYFGNIDPYRNPCNCGQGEEFVPAKKYWRYDSSDNQAGEVEYETRGAKRREYSVRYEDKGICRITDL